MSLSPVPTPEEFETCNVHRYKFNTKHDIDIIDVGISIKDPFFSLANISQIQANLKMYQYCWRKDIVPREL